MADIDEALAGGKPRDRDAEGYYLAIVNEFKDVEGERNPSIEIPYYGSDGTSLEVEYKYRTPNDRGVTEKWLISPFNDGEHLYQTTEIGRTPDFSSEKTERQRAIGPKDVARLKDIYEKRDIDV